MKLRFLTLIPFTALLTGCPDEEKKDVPAAPSASVSAIPTQTAAPATATATASATATTTAADASAPVDAGKVTDAGKTDGAAPKK